MKVRSTPALASQAYNRKPVWRRILVLLAGPFANFLFAAVAYWILLVVGTPALKPVIGDVTADSDCRPAPGCCRATRSSASAGRPVATREGAVLAILDRLMDGTPIELEVQADEGAGSPPRASQLEIDGDRRALDRAGRADDGPRLRLLVSDGADRNRQDRAGQPGGAGRRCRSATGRGRGRASRSPISRRMVKIVQPSPGKTLTFAIERKGERLERPDRGARRSATATAWSAASASSRPRAWRCPPSMKTVERFGPLAAVGRAVEKTWDMSVLTIRMIWNVATGDVSVKNLSGPINIAEYAGFSARQGILSFLSFLAVVSVSLFVLNLLPIPILDGGQVVYQLAELVKGSPLSERAQAVGQQIGILLLLMLMSFAFYNDLSRLFS